MYEFGFVLKFFGGFFGDEFIIWLQFFYSIELEDDVIYLVYVFVGFYWIWKGVFVLVVFFIFFFLLLFCFQEGSCYMSKFFCYGSGVDSDYENI